MTTNTYPMTINGYTQLENELERLKFKERPAVIKAIAEARSHGDISENAEYDAAKEKQAFVEGKIKEIETKLSLAQVINPKTIHQDGRVVFGVTVSLLDVNTDTKTSYQIVGDDEANLKESKISINSPVAKSLIGKYIGDVVEVNTPSGVREYEVLEIKY